MPLVHKIVFEKYAKVREAFDGVWGTVLAVSNVDRIEIVYDSYLEFSIKELTKIGRAKEEPIEIINLILDWPFPPETKKLEALFVSKKRLQEILSRN